MEDGSIVYLCENLFSKFRDYFDWMKSNQNSYVKDVKTTKIENKFQLIVHTENEAVVALFDDVFDKDMGSSIPGYKNDEFNSIIRNLFISIKNEFIDIEDIRYLITTQHFFTLKKFKRKSFIFKVPFDKLTKIEAL